MADSDLEAIRQARRQELQSQNGENSQGGQNQDEQKYVRVTSSPRAQPKLFAETAKQKLGRQYCHKFSNPMQQIGWGEYEW